MGGEGKTP